MQTACLSLLIGPIYPNLILIISQERSIGADGEITLVAGGHWRLEYWGQIVCEKFKNLLLHTKLPSLCIWYRIEQRKLAKFSVIEHYWKSFDWRRQNYSRE